MEALQPRLNIHPSDDDFVLAVSWLLACLRGRGPYPLMVIGGEQGTAKSTRSAILKSVIDPNAPSLRALPQQDRDLFIAAKNRHVLAFDNVSGLPTWVSDRFAASLPASVLRRGSFIRTRTKTSLKGRVCSSSMVLRTLSIGPILPSVPCFSFAGRSGTRIDVRKMSYGPRLTRHIR